MQSAALTRISRSPTLQIGSIRTEPARLHGKLDNFVRCSSARTLEPREILDAARVLKTRIHVKRVISLGTGIFLGVTAYRNIPASPWTTVAAIAIGLVSYLVMSIYPSHLLCHLLDPLLPQPTPLLLTIKKRQNSMSSLYAIYSAILLYSFLQGRINSSERFVSRGISRASGLVYDLKVLSGRVTSLIQKAERGQISTQDQFELAEMNGEFKAILSKHMRNMLGQNR